MSTGAAPLIRDLKTTPHSRMVFFRDTCPDDPVGPCIPLVITRHPDSWKLPNTGQVTLSVTAVGTSPRYQWYRGVRGDVSNKISGAVYPMLTTDPMLSQSQSYWVRVYDDCGNEFYSETATITHVLSCPAINIVTHPASSTTIPEGGSTTLSVVASSENPLSYQWEWSTNWSHWYPVYNSNSPSIVVSPGESTVYRAKIMNGCTSPPRLTQTAFVQVLRPPRDHAVALRTYYSNFVGAEGGGGAGVHATAGAAYEWERFTLTDLNGGQLMDGDLVTLRSHNGHYVVADWCGGPGRTVNADRSSAGDWETFQIRNMDGPYEIGHQSNVALKACSGNGYYVVAEYGGLNGGGPGAGEVNCDRSQAGAWESFQILWQ